MPILLQNQNDLTNVKRQLEIQRKNNIKFKNENIANSNTYSDGLTPEEREKFKEVDIKKLNSFSEQEKTKFYSLIDQTKVPEIQKQLREYQNYIRQKERAEQEQRELRDDYYEYKAIVRDYENDIKRYRQKIAQGKDKNGSAQRALNDRLKWLPHFQYKLRQAELRLGKVTGTFEELPPEYQNVIIQQNAYKWANDPKYKTTTGNNKIHFVYQNGQITGVKINDKLAYDKNYVAPKNIPNIFANVDTSKFKMTPVNNNSLFTGGITPLIKEEQKLSVPEYNQQIIQLNNRTNLNLQTITNEFDNDHINQVAEENYKKIKNYNDNLNINQEEEFKEKPSLLDYATNTAFAWKDFITEKPTYYEIDNPAYNNPIYNKLGLPNNMNPTTKVIGYPGRMKTIQTSTQKIRNMLGAENWNKIINEKPTYYEIDNPYYDNEIFKKLGLTNNMNPTTTVIGYPGRREIFETGINYIPDKITEFRDNWFPEFKEKRDQFLNEKPTYYEIDNPYYDNEIFKKLGLTNNMNPTTKVIGYPGRMKTIQTSTQKIRNMLGAENWNKIINEKPTYYEIDNPYYDNEIFKKLGLTNNMNPTTTVIGYPGRREIILNTGLPNTTNAIFTGSKNLWKNTFLPPIRGIPKTAMFLGDIGYTIGNAENAEQNIETRKQILNDLNKIAEKRKLNFQEENLRKLLKLTDYKKGGITDPDIQKTGIAGITIASIGGALGPGAQTTAKIGTQYSSARAFINKPNLEGAIESYGDDIFLYDLPKIKDVGNELGYQVYRQLPETIKEKIPDIEFPYNMTPIEGTKIDKYRRKEFADESIIAKLTTKKQIELNPKTNIESVDGMNTRLANSLRKFFRKQDGFMGGSTIINTIKNIELAKKPADIEWYTKDPEIFKNELQNYAKKEGFKTTTYDGKLYIDNVKIDINPLKTGKGNIESVGSKYWKYYVLKNKDGINIIDPRILVRRSLIGAYEPGKKGDQMYRYPKDIPRLYSEGQAVIKQINQNQNAPWVFNIADNYRKGLITELLKRYEPPENIKKIIPIKYRGYEKLPIKAKTKLDELIIKELKETGGYIGGTGAVYFQIAGFRKYGDLDIYFPKGAKLDAEQFSALIAKKYNLKSIKDGGTHNFILNKNIIKDKIAEILKTNPRNISREIADISNRATPEKIKIIDGIPVRDWKLILKDKKAIVRTIEKKMQLKKDISTKDLSKYNKAKKDIEMMMNPKNPKINYKIKNPYPQIKALKYIEMPKDILMNQKGQMDLIKKNKKTKTKNQIYSDFTESGDIYKDSIQKYGIINPYKQITENYKYPETYKYPENYKYPETYKYPENYKYP
ncbi:MAG TPA: hypothetical protein PK993_03900, partial [Clostridia bacterium]|nr:hypothetical protein [Clostridia bacterium]